MYLGFHSYLIYALNIHVSEATTLHWQAATSLQQLLPDRSDQSQQWTRVKGDLVRASLAKILNLWCNQLPPPGLQ